VTVSSTGPWEDSLGVYTKTAGTWDGRHVWGHTRNSESEFKNFLFYNGDWSKWVINNRVSNGGAWMVNKNEGLITIPQTGWKYWDDSNFNKDKITLRVTEGEPNYPATVTVSSTGVAADGHSDSMGVYTKTTQTRSGRPVWQHTGGSDRFFFYEDINVTKLRWVIKDFNGRIYIRSKNKNLIDIPLTGWTYWDGSNYQDDNTLRITGYY